MLAQSRRIKSAPFPSYLLVGLILFLFAYFALLSPSSLEEDFNGVRVVHPNELLKFLKNETEPMIAQGVPNGVTPSYSLRYFDFFSTSENKPQLKFTAKKSNFYQKQDIIHAREVLVSLPDQTSISSQEALFKTRENEIEFYGNVLIAFKSGLLIRTHYMNVLTQPVLHIEIPQEEALAGEKPDPSGGVSFRSYGLTFTDAAPRVVSLISKVTADLQGLHPTQIQSDRAKIHLDENRLKFEMDPGLDFDRQFVQTHQAQMEMKSRTLEVSLSGSKVDRISALGDVSVKDRLFSSTSGKAVFLYQNNRIELSDFPQVYQNSDTITGDLIIYHRDDDTIEVKQSNAVYKR